MEGYFTHKQFIIHYIEFGKGEEILFAFPGFGRQPDDFYLLEDTFGKKYRIIAFSHFHHGKSEYPENRIKSHQIKFHELNEIFQAFAKDKKIEKYALLGYSLGGKIALSILQYLPEKVTALYLFAPDGIKKNIWYNLVSSTYVGRLIYKSIIYFPLPFHLFIRILNKLKLLSTRLYKFVYNQTDTFEKRMQVYKVWLTYKRINPKVDLVQQAIIKHQIHTHIFFGRYDKVIPPEIGKRFITKIKRYAHIHIIYVGHNLICEKTIHYIAKHPGILKSL
ncbi:MAG: alpha/beta hydrolase [Bacteroidia bacterium]